ncbi:MAG: 4-demethylwyosine synthase TYW1 [Candidatus Micrarchaeota archaeon]|nr:4-demethylwyosine synthase TYW1 [Candidatus Micrarchaeota archaeon]MCX8154776.1 4-demethylwyosine synthase TYW1 [Candidatus Micrarchaeota archaeon]
MAKVNLNLDALNSRLKDEYRNGKITFSEEQRKKWANIYGIVGNHSAVHICSWTKKNLKNGPACYKRKFYGIDTHRCAEMSPATAWCHEACVFCWRPMEWYSRITMDDSEVDDPEDIIRGTVEQRKKLLVGFGGNSKVNRRMFREAYEMWPTHWAISLSGEPTIYPKLGQLILKLREHPETRSIFVVSNGQEPEKIWKLKEMDALPTQLYISFSTPNPSMFKKIIRSVYLDGWERLMETLHMLKDLNCRRVIRITLMRGINDDDKSIEEFAEILNDVVADYIEIKSYSYLGQSRKRLSYENVASHDHVREFARKLEAKLRDYRYHNEDPNSLIVLLKNVNSPYQDFIPGPRAEQSLKNGDARI